MSDRIHDLVKRCFSHIFSSERIEPPTRYSGGPSKAEGPHLRFITIVCTLALLAPLAYAHDLSSNPSGVPGTPKNYCEPQSEWNTHEYNVAPGLYVTTTTDGNVAGDCDGVFTLNPGVPCLGVDPIDPINSLFIGLCDSDINFAAADYDGHKEFALGGAYLLAGASAEDCFGEAAHHPEFGHIVVTDLVVGNSAAFTVAADTSDVTGQLGPCGDFQGDDRIECVGECEVTIPAGLDGSYQVYVTGVQGHIEM